MAPKKAPAKKTVAKKTIKPAAKTIVKPVVKAAVKPVVKAAVKPVVKVAPAKKTVETKSAPVVTPAVSPKPSCPISGGCCCAGGRFLKKLIVFFVIFALGFVTCKMMYCGPRHHGMGMQQRPDIFTNGCLDIQKIENPEIADRIAKITVNADVDSDGCITPEELQKIDRPGMGPNGQKPMGNQAR